MDGLALAGPSFFFRRTLIGRSVSYARVIMDVLTRREYEIARLVAAGKQNRTIATDLCLSLRTIENHLYSIYAKLDITSRTQLALLIFEAQSNGFANAV